MNNIKIKINQDTSIKISKIEELLTNNPNSIIILEIDNTKGLLSSVMKPLMNLKGSNRLKFRVIGGYDDDRVRNYPKYIKSHKEDNIYDLDEMEKILTAIENIESGLKPEWDNFQKLIYLIHTLTRKIIYHPFYEKQPSKDIRSLRGLFSRKTVCAGYAMILKELCDRQKIECQYVEGCTTQEDYNKNYLTHAWNIVKLNGNYIPIDLTWNAGADRTGKSLSIEDLANVNQFIKNHIPGKYEKIKDYKRSLKSIDGTKMRTVSNLVNRDTSYDTRMFKGSRKDGAKFVLTQLEQIVIDNKYVYKYIYQDVLKDGTKGPPVILYSDTNVANIVSSIARKRKLEAQLQNAKKNGDTKKVNELRKQLIGSEHLEKTLENLKELLFSVPNIQAAIDRKDYYIGTIDIEKNEDNTTSYKRTFVDPEFGKKVSKKQRTLRRNDGTYFTIEEWPWNCPIKRYIIYEPIQIGSYYTVRRNTIFTDNDILSIKSKKLSDWFLSRTRINKNNGYLGSFNEACIEKINKEYANYINNLFRTFILNSADIRDYYEEITFSEMERLVKTFTVKHENGKCICYNRLTNQRVTDHNLILHIQFATYWLNAAGIKWYFNEPIPGYNYAFNDEAEKIFNQIRDLIVYSLNKNGNIDPIEIYDIVEQNSHYKYTANILIRLFSSQHRVQVINELFRLQNPSSIKSKQDIPYFSSEIVAQSLLYERRKLEAQKQILEIIKNGSTVQMIPKRKSNFK